MAPVRKLPLTKPVLQKIREHVKMHCEAFASDTVYLNSIGSIPGGRTLIESHSWPIRDAFDYFQNLGAGRLEGDSFKVLDQDYFGVNTRQVNVPVSFSIDERIRSDLLVMIDVYAQVYDVENRLRFFLNQKLREKYGPDYVFRLPQRVQERIEHEKSRATFYVTDPQKGDLAFCHFSDLRRILMDNEEFVSVQQGYSLLLDELDYLNSIRNLAAHNNLIVPFEIARIRNTCDIVRLIAGAEQSAHKQEQPSEAQLSSIDI